MQVTAGSKECQVHAIPSQITLHDGMTVMHWATMHWSPAGLDLPPMPVRLIQQTMTLLQLCCNESFAISVKVSCWQLGKYALCTLEEGFDAFLQL